MGYSPAQLAALARALDAVPADVVVAGTPVDLAALASIAKPVVRARYEFAELDSPGLGGVLDGFLERIGLASAAPR
jgi:predicted GTPase